MNRPIVALVALIAVTPAGAAAQVSLGEAGSALSGRFAAQRDVAVDPDTGVVGFIHRQEASLGAGDFASTRVLRLALSFDRGASFVTQQGPFGDGVDPLLSYPSLAFSRDTGVTVSAHMESNAYSTDSRGASFLLSAPVAAERQVDVAGLVEAWGIPSSLAVRVPGEFWWIRGGRPAGSLEQQYEILRVWADEGVLGDPEVVSTVTAPVDNASVHHGQPTIGFSPDGRVGWAFWLGDRVGGEDPGLRPVATRSLDGGESWSSPQEIGLGELVDRASGETVSERFSGMFPWTTELFGAGVQLPEGLSDVAPCWWSPPPGGWDVDPGELAAGYAAPTPSRFGGSLVVDGDGNPHYFIAVFPGAGSYNGGVPGAVLMLDITSADGGESFAAIHVGSEHTWAHAVEDSFDPGVALAVSTLKPQVARNPAGDRIFYSWAATRIAPDWDSADLPFRNDAPDLHVSGWRVADASLAPVFDITGEEERCGEREAPPHLPLPEFAGRAYLPKMASLVFTEGDRHHLPLVLPRVDPSLDFGLATEFVYVGAEVWLDESDFGPPLESPEDDVPPTDGCGCSAVAGSSEGSLLLGLVGLGALWRRRRSARGS